MCKAVNSIGYGKALLQQWKVSVIIHTYKQVDETAVIMEAYIPYQLRTKFYLKIFSNFSLIRCSSAFSALYNTSTTDKKMGIQSG